MTQHYHFTVRYGFASNEELKKCPCCGGKAGIRQDYEVFWRVQCDSCGMQTLNYITPEYAIKVWNRMSSDAEIH